MALGCDGDIAVVGALPLPRAGAVSTRLRVRLVIVLVRGLGHASHHRGRDVEVEDIIVSVRAAGGGEVVAPKHDRLAVGGDLLRDGRVAAWPLPAAEALHLILFGARSALLAAGSCWAAKGF